MKILRFIKRVLRNMIININNLGKSNIKRAKKIIYSSTQVRINLGCGPKKLKGYVNVDICPSFATDLVMDSLELLKNLSVNSIDEIRMDAVFEHYYMHEQEEILEMCRRVLKKGGKLVINSLPDFEVIVDAYINKGPGVAENIFGVLDAERYIFGFPGGKEKNNEFQLHKDIFTKDKIKKQILSAGFSGVEASNAYWEDEKIPVNINVVAIK